MRFCGLGPGDTVPDANTLWDFREALIAAGALDALFARLDRAITEAGYLPMAGQIVDATLVAAPRQRNTDAEKAAIKGGKGAAEIWPEMPAKARQKDTDARWTMKFSKAKPTADDKPQIDIAIPTFGYKNHISIDRRHGIIRRGKVTDAAAHDGIRLREGLIDPNNTASDVWADSAYRSAENERFLARIGKLSRIHRRKPKGKPMPKRTARANQVRGVRPCRASLRPPEGADGPRDPHHRHRARHRERDARQHGLQHEAMVLARPAKCARMTPQGPKGGCFDPLKRP
jgi:IS5 family transposase